VLTGRDLRGSSRRDLHVLVFVLVSA